MLVRTSEPSPDGQWIAFSTEARHEDIFVMRADGSELRQLTSDPHRDRGVSWSADGKRIAFYSTRSGPYEAWSIQPDGSGLTQLTRTPGVNYPVFLPDGRRLVNFDLTKAHIVDLSSPPSSKAETIPPLPDGGSPFIATAWSPDGTRLAGRRWSGPTDVYVYSLAEKKYATFAAPTRIGRGEVEWIDGRRLLFPGGDGVLYVIDTDTGKTRRTGEFNADTFRASRNGRHAVLGRRSAEADVWLMSTGEEGPRVESGRRVTPVCRTRWSIS